MLEQMEVIKRQMHSLPIAWLLVDQDSKLIEMNPRAETFLNLQLGQCLVDKIHQDSMIYWRRLLSQSSCECLIQFDLGNEQYRYGSVSLDGESNDVAGNALRSVYIQDFTSAVRQRQEYKHAMAPERKFIHELSNALTTTLGYSELMSMSFNEQDVLDGEQLDSVRSYHLEVFNGLNRVNGLIKECKKNRRESKHSNGPQVMVIDPSPDDTMALTDILNQLGCKAVTHTDLQDAFLSIAQSNDQFEFIVMGQSSQLESRRIIQLIGTLDHSPPLVMFVSEMSYQSEINQPPNLHLVKKPIDPDEVRQIFSGLLI